MTDGPSAEPRSDRRRRTRVRTAAAALAAVGLLVLGWIALVPDGQDGGELRELWATPDFALVDQTGDTLRAADLEGTAWVAHFFFTSCEGVCPLTTARMAALRDSLAADGALGEEVRLVSISVDPARDTPSVLREYAARYGDPAPSEWAFLTGSPPERVRRLLQEGFRVTASPPPARADTAAGYQVNHSPRLELVDRTGRVRATYDATGPAAIGRLLSDLGTLLR